MLTHGRPQATKPGRVVVLGGGGFIAGAILRRLRDDGIAATGLGRPVLDLLAPGAAQQLAGALDAEDTLVFASAVVPCKDLPMLAQNTRMLEAVCTALAKRPVAHLVYLSSDAVYRDSPDPLSEGSCAEPNSFHGLMHLTREVALRQHCAGPFAIVRPTLVYGLDDPHNGYGPNRFRRLAADGKEIVLFGEGEERRDHVDVRDVAELVRLIILHRSAGVANAVSGEVVSFRALAEHAAAAFAPNVGVKGSSRNGPMPHNGYRAFYTSLACEAFPGFRFRGWREGLTAVHEQQMQRENTQ